MKFQNLCSLGQYHLVNISCAREGHDRGDIGHVDICMLVLHGGNEPREGANNVELNSCKNSLGQGLHTHRIEYPEQLGDNVEVEHGASNFFKRGHRPDDLGCHQGHVVDWQN